jgi:ABC-type uncharacterized transport system involved in gliding motility auxiliary subunit
MEGLMTEPSPSLETSEPPATPRPAPRRRWLVGANAAVTVLLLAVLLLLVNFLGSRRYVTRDLTPTKITALSPKTKEVLGQLKEPVDIVVFYQTTHRLFELVQDLLEQYEAVSDKVVVSYVDPEQDLAKARQLVQKHQIDLNKDPLNQIIVGSGGRTKFLTEAELAQYDYRMAQRMGRPLLVGFTGEDALTSAILSVSQSTQPVVWFLSGHGEKALEDTGPQGISELKKYLERENMTVRSETLLDKSEIPSSASMLVIAGPARRFAEQELVLLQAFLARGGRLLALIDPSTNTGLDDLLARWGAELGQDVVVDPARQLPFVSSANVFVVSYTEHPIVRHMETLMTLFPLARSVKPAPGDQQMQATELAATSEEGWGETTLTSDTFEKDAKDTPGPVPLAVASERLQPSAARLVVVGDSDFAGNDQLGNVGNLDLVRGAFHWLVGQEQLIGIGPKPIASLKVSVTAAQLSLIFWLSFAILPCLFAGAGIAVWWVRRA